jgi:PadR family transcriptional regulator, regulatory protein AphA
MKLEHYILGLLITRPQTGYDIKAFMDSEGRFVRPSTPLSQIYTTLKRMTQAGWIRFEEELREGKPDLKIYSTTPLGEQILREWLAAPHVPSFRFQDREFLGKLTFSFLIAPEIVLQQCRTELVYRKEQIARFRGRNRTVRVAASAGISAADVQFLADQMHEYGKGAIDQYVVWLEEFIRQLETRLKENPS